MDSSQRQNNRGSRLWRALTSFVQTIPTAIVQTIEPAQGEVLPDFRERG